MKRLGLVILLVAMLAVAIGSDCAVDGSAPDDRGRSRHLCARESIG